MAAAFATSNHKKTKSTQSPKSPESELPVVPPEKEWENNIELGMLMLNG
jgi:hypothetical protein